MAKQVALNYLHRTRIPGLSNRGFSIGASVTNAVGSTEPCSSTAFTQLDADDALKGLGGDAADTTQTLTVLAVNASNQLWEYTGTLNGTSQVAVDTEEKAYVLQAYLDAEAAGNTTVEKADGTDLMIITAGQLGTNITHWAMCDETGPRSGVITSWEMRLSSADADVVGELRLYPTIADARDMGDGYQILDSCSLASTMGVGYSSIESSPAGFRIPPGSYVAVAATGVTGDVDANLNGYLL